MIAAIVTTILTYPFQIALGILAIVYGVRAGSIALRRSRSESNTQATPRAGSASSLVSGRDNAPSAASTEVTVTVGKDDEPTESSCPAAGSSPGHDDHAGETA
jgi:hypothetical protein